MRKSRDIVGFAIIIFGLGMLFLEPNFLVPYAIMSFGQLILPTEKKTESYQPDPFWKAYFIKIFFLGLITWTMRYFFGPISFYDIQFEGIQDPITRFTEKTITTWDIGLGYTLWVAIYVLIILVLAVTATYLMRILKILRPYLSEPFYKYLVVFGKNRRFFGISVLSVPIVIVIAMLIALYIYFLFRWFLPLTSSMSDFIFGMHSPTVAFRISQPINRLTSIFASIGASPSFSKISSSFLTITTLWGSYEGAIKMIRVADELLRSKRDNGSSRPRTARDTTE